MKELKLHTAQQGPQLRIEVWRLKPIKQHIEQVLNSLVLYSVVDDTNRQRKFPLNVPEIDEKWEYCGFMNKFNQSIESFEWFWFCNCTLLAFN